MNEFGGREILWSRLEQTNRIISRGDGKRLKDRRFGKSANVIVIDDHD